MPKTKNSPILTCDICDFKASNSYIFKRHLHRCLSLHGIASKKSSSRNPIRLKGTEGLLSKDCSKEDTKDLPSFSGLEDDYDQVLSADERDELPHPEGETEGEQTRKIISPQWGHPSDSQMTLLKKAEELKENPNIYTETDENPLFSDSSPFIPGAPYCRQYNCNECSYECKSARDYLLHQRNVHGHKIRIYACQFCDYASRYGNKVERHMTVHIKPGVNMEDQERLLRAVELTSPTAELQTEPGSSESGMLNTLEPGTDMPKIQPLKLKRLNIKMPFKVSRSSKLKTGFMFKSKKRNGNKMALMLTSEFTPRANSGPYKEVYRMVMSEDGTHHYRCRDCLYYAAIPSSVKKHHALCHGRLLYCPHCSLSTSGQGIYYEHLITHEGFGYVKCPDCSYVTNAKSNYEKHRSFHGGDFPFHCTVCSFGADSESKIKRHVATQHRPMNADFGEEQNVAEDGMVGSHDNGLNNEQTIEGDTAIRSLDDLEMEGENIQSDDGSENIEDIPEGEGPHIEYRCPKCSMICYRRGNFTRHLTSKHKFNQSSAASLSKSMESQIFRGLKLKKKRIASSFAGLKQIRLQTAENLKCSHCSYIAKWPSDLRRHMQVHTIVKRFKCSICTNKYKYLGDLNVHMRRDHNTEPPENIAREIATSDVLTKASPAIYRCPICPFTSHSKAELEQHSRQHGITEKTYQCRLCDYQTYWRGDVSRHLFRHHKIILSKEASEIGAYFLHRPDIKPLTKQGTAAGISGISPLLSPDTSKNISMDSPVIPEFAIPNPNPKSSGKVKTSLKKKNGHGPVFLKEGSFVCEYPNCDFKTTISGRMEAHIAVHQNLKQFMCPTCGKRTNWKWDVVKHMIKVHMNPGAVIEDVITLSIDEAKATIQEYLINYEKKSKDLTVSYCSLCTFKSLERNRVVRHLGTIHKSENGKVISQTMFGSYEQGSASSLKTEDGNVSFENEGGLSGEGIALPALKFIEPPPEELAKYEKPYACAICKKPGSSKGDVKKHYNYTHPYKDVRILYIGDGTEFNYYNGEIYQKSFKSDQSMDFPDVKTGMFPMSPLGKIPRPDSKFSNPKMHGYVKPFKCSICGLRSNWKWDLKKHLRSKHINEGGFVILLSIEEASETYGRDCTPSHPKNEDFLSIPTSSPSQVPLVSATDPSPVPTDDHMFKPPPNIKAEILPDSNGDDSEEELQSLSSFFPQSPASSLSPSPMHRGRDRSTFLDPSRRQWKCSGCNYISNWRRNMARHIHRKHPGEEDKVQVLALHSEPSEEFSKNDSMKYLTQDDEEESMDIEEESSSDDDLPQEIKPNIVQSDLKMWNCPTCAFSSTLRTHIIVHMQQHEMKPFLCGVCNIPFMNRGPLHRHLQKVHKRSDYLKLCKLNIKYDDVAEDMTRAEYINSYFCRLCNLESTNRQEIAQHLEEAHGSVETDNNILKIQKHVGGSAKKKTTFAKLSKNDAQKLNRKFHFCTLCPYRSQKKSMLAFHMTYHKPNPTNRFKCKHCPYYVGALRLLHQHQRKWHKEPASKIQWEQEGQATPNPSPAKVHTSTNSPVGTPRRHCCEKCPYTTNSKNDFIYHKQFHRPKRTAEFKCEYCDYWVVHKRLLKQHMRLHTGPSTNHGASVDISPAKSLCSDPGLVYDPLELTELAAIKQKMISAKITASLSKSPNISPMKIASQCSVDNKPGYIIKNGLYRKLHKCRFCPYTNIRSRNMQLHEMMHGPRDSNHPLMKCPYCDYYVGSKGLLSHHMKVHQKNYGDTPENDAELTEIGETVENDEDSDPDILPQQKVDTLLQISRFKRFGCERCPYASAKRQHFVRHLELHGSRQRYTCQYCDYSVPSNNLLLQHTRLHMMPNQNLLASQSITNLQHLSEVPADVALASALPPADSDTAVTINVIHDHLGLYENSIYDSEPKKLYRCDRCPYANVRRDYLLSHLKFHMVPSALVCPYCDYSAPKQPLLTQHIRVHFCPLPELSDWLLENGQMQRETSQRNLDLTEALKVAHEYQNQSKKKDKGKTAISNVDKTTGKEDKLEGKENIQDKINGDAQLTYICQYCDREFPASDKLVKHELQHLIGNHFERAEYISWNKKIVEQATMHILSAQEKQEKLLEEQHHQELQHAYSLENDHQDDDVNSNNFQDISEMGQALIDNIISGRDEIASPFSGTYGKVKVKNNPKKVKIIGDKTKGSVVNGTYISDRNSLISSDKDNSIMNEHFGSSTADLLISSIKESNLNDSLSRNVVDRVNEEMLSLVVDNTSDSEQNKDSDSLAFVTINSSSVKDEKEVRMKRKKASKREEDSSGIYNRASENVMEILETGVTIGECAEVEECEQGKCNIVVCTEVEGIEKGNCNIDCRKNDGEIVNGIMGAPKIVAGDERDVAEVSVKCGELDDKRQLGEDVNHGRKEINLCSVGKDNSEGDEMMFCEEEEATPKDALLRLSVSTEDIEEDKASTNSELYEDVTDDVNLLI